MPNIYDNIENRFADGLLKHSAGATRVDYCVGYFNLRGWKVVSDSIQELIGEKVVEGQSHVMRYCRLLIGMTKTPAQELQEEFLDPNDLMVDTTKANRYRKRLAQEFAEQLTCGMPTQEDEKTLKQLLEQMRSGRVVVKVFLKHQLHAKLYLAYHPDTVTEKLALLGSSNFTNSGLNWQGELNVDVLEQDAASKLVAWFSDRWADRWCIDITTDLIEVLENSWARPELISPYLIYLKMAYHLCREARAGLAEYNLSKEFAQELLEFQQAAVKIAAHHLHHRHGVMIGDVVGLGKTITATAVAKIMEDDLYYNTLITCPKSLVSMWANYVEKYGLHARVVSHSMLPQELPDMKRYRLVIIDESHNFTNSSGERYRALKTYIEENDSKVILLSATPYNKTYSDLSNQLRLFLPDDYDLGIIPERYINELGGTVRFNAKHTDTNVRTINAFEKSDHADDWREVMKLYLVRRTRSFIKDNYAKTDEQTGRKYLEFTNGEKSFFPDRRPLKVEFSLNSGDSLDQYAHLYDDHTVSVINALTLPRYGLQQYFDENHNSALTNQEASIMDDLSRAGRRILGFCRTSLYKRLESSGYAFMLSVSRHILRNYIFLYALKHGLQLPVSGQSIDIDMYSDDDENEDDLRLDYSWTVKEYEVAAKDYYEKFQAQYHRRFKWIRSELFNTEKLTDGLEADANNLLAVLHKVKKWQPLTDRKLQALYSLITDKHKHDKIIVFTQFADTANYLYTELEKQGVDAIGLAIGGKANIVELAERFSPLSNQRPIPKSAELRVLISTDVLSEGQNLQDAHVIVNFDLPWAIVRLIQRAGRVDRLGQKARKILCYSFLPEDGIERIIRLRALLTKRISENAEVVGSDEVFFDGDPVNISDLYNEKAGVLDDEEDNEVDLASYAYQIWKNAIDARPELKAQVESLPNVVFSAKAYGADSNTEGVIVYARTSSDNDSLIWLNKAGGIVTQSQLRILKAAECDYHTAALEKASYHHELVAQAIKRLESDESVTGGTLGRKNSVKYRAFMRLDRYLNQNQGTIFASESLKKAHDAIYRYPLREGAIDALSRQMKSGIDDQQLVELVTSLYDEDKLCVISDDLEQSRATQIICSMGLVGDER